MRTWRWSRVLAAGCVAAMSSIALAQQQPPGALNQYPQGQLGPDVPAFYVRQGLRVELAAENLGNARMMIFDDHGILYLARPSSGDILALKRGADGKYTQLGTLVSGHPTVHGLDFHDGWLWFTESGAIFKTKTTADGKVDGPVVTVIAPGTLPKGGGHWYRPIAVTDDGFFTSIGDAQNASDGTGQGREIIWHYALDGTGQTMWASGIRNTEKLRFQPGTSELWGCDHGSDNIAQPLGEKPGHQPITDLQPPDEINHYTKGGFYGHPWITGNRIPRYQYLQKDNILELAARTTPPAWSLGAHWAPNGWTFVTKTTAVAQAGDMLVGLHGSWNSTQRVGYGVERILFDDQTKQPIGMMRLVTTEVDGHVLARPVDVVQEPDGGILFSDDSGNKIYRITAAH